jgi:hypothetical protein
LGKTPLSGDTLKNASNDELSARSKNIKSEGKNLVSEYQSLDSPFSASGETIVACESYTEQQVFPIMSLDTNSGSKE